MRASILLLLFSLLGCTDDQSSDEYILNESMYHAKMNRCLELSVCRMDCAVLIFGHQAGIDAFYEHTKQPCRLTDEDGKLKEIFLFESKEPLCQADTGTTCSGVDKVVELFR